MHQRGFTLTELALSAAVAGVAAALAGPVMMSPEARRAVSLRNMQVIGAAGGSYRLDHDEYLPIGMINHPRAASPSPSGWCTWSVGGKNNNGWWVTPSQAALRYYDIEAADRPLNAYAMPSREFYAPPAPAQLPKDHSARLIDQAPVFRDPSDLLSHQRRWPAPNPTAISSYDDVGTSYHWNSQWWRQLWRTSGDLQRMAEGAQRLATGQGARPDRFVWMYDQLGDLVHVQTPAGTTLPVPLLFIDGRAGILNVTKGQYITANYTLVFEDLPAPG